MNFLRQTLFFLCMVSLSACEVPDPILPDLPVPDGSRSSLVVLVHGSGDSPEAWPAELEQVLTEQLVEPSDWDLLSYDWEEDAAQRLVAAELGLLHGSYLGERLLEDAVYSQVHVIGHSVGAFVLYGVEQVFAGAGDTPPVLHSTYLDPFCARGSDVGFGETHFGQTATFADAYYNRDDPAPSTNGSLASAHNFDVTGGKPSDVSGRDGHWWPVHFYKASEASETAGLALTLEVAQADLSGLHEAWPRGEETSVE